MGRGQPAVPRSCNGGLPRPRTRYSGLSSPHWSFFCWHHFFVARPGICTSPVTFGLSQLLIFMQCHDALYLLKASKKCPLIFVPCEAITILAPPAMFPSMAENTASCMPEASSSRYITWGEEIPAAFSASFAEKPKIWLPLVKVRPVAGSSEGGFIHTCWRIGVRLYAARISRHAMSFT